MQDLSSRTNRQAHASCMEGWCLNHWTLSPSKSLTSICRGKFVLTVLYSQWQSVLILLLFSQVFCNILQKS